MVMLQHIQFQNFYSLFLILWRKEMWNFYFIALNIVLKEAVGFTAFCIPGLQLLQLTNHIILEFAL